MQAQGVFYALAAVVLIETGVLFFAAYKFSRIAEEAIVDPSPSPLGQFGNKWFINRALSHVLYACAYFGLSDSIFWYALSQYTPNDEVPMWFLLVISASVFLVGIMSVRKLIHLFKCEPTSVD